MADEKKSPKISLPVLRKGLTINFGDYDREGKPYWLIHDSGRNKFFIIGWAESQILEQWDLGTPQAIIDVINTKTTLHIDEKDIENVIRFLKQNYLVRQTGYEIHTQGKDQELFKKDSWIHWLISHYLFFRVPLWHPDKFLTRTQHIASYVFHRYVGYIMMVLALIALFQISTRWNEFTHTFASIFTLKGIFFYFIAFSVCKFCHELGHAYRCKQYDVPVPSLGVAFLVFWPVLYTDTTLSWRLKSYQRMQIALAGIWVETYVTIIAALIWCNTNNLTLSSICYLVITVNWVGSLLINVSPFMRFDGYYVLADYLKMPNLQPRAFALTKWQIRRWLFNFDEPPPENYTRRMHNFLVVYSLITWIYRLILYVGIAVLVYHFFIKIIGIILFVIEVFYFILKPVINEFKVWYAYKDQFKWNKSTIRTAVLSGVILIFFLLPIQETLKIPATLSYQHEFLIAPEAGVITNTLPKIGERVKAKQPVVVIQSPDLDNALNLVRLEYRRKLNDLRNSQINSNFFNQKDVATSELNKSVAQYEKLYALRQRLILKAPFDGIIYEVAPDLEPGMYVMKDEWIADVVRTSSIKIEGYVEEKYLYLVKDNLVGYFYPHSLSDKKVAVKVVAVDALNTSQLNCYYSANVKQDKKQNSVIDTPCYNANELGGDIPTYLTDEGAFVPVESVYRVLLKPEEEVSPSHIQRGTIVLNTKARSVSSRFFYWIKTLLVEESGF